MHTYAEQGITQADSARKSGRSPACSQTATRSFFEQPFHLIQFMLQNIGAAGQIRGLRIERYTLVGVTAKTGQIKACWPDGKLMPIAMGAITAD